MTHDELLAKINKAISIYEEQGFDANDYLYALRAVVELHHPLYYRHGEIETRGAKCSDCNIEYPCSTIQAIERQLNS